MISTRSLTISSPLKITFGFCLAAALIIGAIQTVAAVGHAPKRPEIADFHAFMIAGQLAWHGQLGEAYKTATMLALEQHLGGEKIFMPWSYPPIFGLILAPLSQLPLGAAFMLFGLATLAAYMTAMFRLDGKDAWPALLATAPTIIINLRTGQNGLLTGALFALAAASLLKRKQSLAGAAIGGLAIKPHLAVIWPVLLIVQRRWIAFAWAGAVAVAITGLSLLIAGPKVFAAFLQAGSSVSQGMAAGDYPLPRMTSLYAAVRSFGVSPNLALALHGLIAAGVLAASAYVARQWDTRTQIGLAIAASVFISPYFYDYDQTIFGVGLALLLPALTRRMSTWRQGLFLTAVGVALIVGVPLNTAFVRLSLGGPLILMVFIFILMDLKEARAGQTAQAGPFASQVSAG